MENKEIINLILRITGNYRMVPADTRSFKREGHKERVEPELRVFNGKPQLIVFYGKTRYTYNIVPRGKESKAAMLMSVTGYKGIENIPGDVLKALGFTETELELRKAMLAERGV